MVHGMKWSVLGRGASQTISWVMTLITIRILAPQDFGLIALCESVTIFIGYSNELGLGVAIVQNERITRRELGAMNTFFVAWNGALYLLLFALAPTIATFYREPELTDVLRVIGVSALLLGPSVVPRSLLMREMRFRDITLVKAGSGLAAGMVTVLAALDGHGVWSLVAGALCGALLETIGYHLAQRAPPDFGLGFAALRPHFRFGAAIMVQRLIWIGYMKADILVIGRLFDTHTTGLYAVGRELAFLPLDRLGAAVNQVVFAGFARLKHDTAAVAHLALRGITLLCFMSFPIFLGLSAVAVPLVRTILGPGWGGAAAVMTLMALAGPMRLINTIAVEILNALGAARDNLRQVLLTAAAVLGGIALGVQWGIAGLCIGWLAGYLVGTLLHLRALAGHVPIDAGAGWRGVARPLVGCAAMYLAVHATLDLLSARAPLLGLAAGIGVGVGVYAAWSLLAMRAELRTLRDALGRGAPTGRKAP